MKRSPLFSALFALFAFFVQFAIGAAQAPYDVSIKDIFNRPYDLAQETVRLKGKAIEFIVVKVATSRGYIFQDGWKDKIKIITKNENPPQLGGEYLVTGIVFVDNTNKADPEIYILEINRENSPNEGQGDTTPSTGTNPPGNKNEKLVNVLFGIAAGLLIVIASFAIFMILGKSKDGLTSAFSSSYADDTDSGLSSYPEPASYIEDSSIKFAAPPEGTLKLLPGRLEIVAGYDQVKEIRFYKHPKQEETEFTLGRESGTPYLQFQLKSPTVSAKHAKIMWTNKKYMLINYAVTNPTKVNDAILEKDQSVILEDNSVIEMGEIIFKFHEK